MSRGLGSRADVDDGVQEVFIKVFRSLPNLRQNESIRSYVVAITMTTIRTELRKRKLRRFWGLESLGGDVPDAPAAPSDLGVRLALQRLELALERLKADDRIAFCLRYVEAMELSEVASAMGWSLASTKRYLARAKQRLWVLVEKDCVLAPYLESAGAIGKERR
jgi:RNA polymerase sigma-70 factor (ECF subfamily)